MRKVHLFILCFFTLQIVYSQPANDACLSATSLTSGSNLCNQNSTNSTLQSGECNLDFAGSTEGTMWYSFTASTSSLVLNFIQNNNTNAAPNYVVYGPYSSLSAGCTNVTSACSGGSVLATAQPTNHVSGPVGGVSYNLVNGDPGKYTMLTGLNTTSGNNTYLVQVQNNNSGGGGDRWAQFCIGVHTPATNSVPQAASAINSCGVTYNGSSAGGYYPNASGAGFSNLDNNAGTQCGSCASGADVTYVINNPSWFTFCSANAGTYNVQFDVISCVNSAFTGATGGQMAILTGSPTSLTSVWQATSPTLTNTAVQTSPNFTLAAGGCAYLVLDGFAGDACSYSYVLTNVSGGCVLLPIELKNFDAKVKNGVVDLMWETMSERNNDYYSVERSVDARNFEVIKNIKGAGNSDTQKSYIVVDNNPLIGLSYYRLKQTDYDGKSHYSEIKTIEVGEEDKFTFNIFPNPLGNGVDLSLIFNSKKNDVITIVILNLTGEVISEKEITLDSANPVIQIKHKFEAGLYLVKVINKKGIVEYKKFIVK